MLALRALREGVLRRGEESTTDMNESSSTRFNQRAAHVVEAAGVWAVVEKAASQSWIESGLSNLDPLSLFIPLIFTDRWSSLWTTLPFAPARKSLASVAYRQTLTTDGQSTRRLGHGQSDRRMIRTRWYDTLANGDASRLPSATGVASSAMIPISTQRCL